MHFFGFIIFSMLSENR